MHPDFPELASKHMVGAKLYATRNDLVRDLALPPGPRLAEVGVALGAFSKFLIQNLKPSAFHGFDLFQLHHVEYLWGEKTSDVMRGLTHVDFYREEMINTGLTVTVHEGSSHLTLESTEDEYFNMIYVDAEHTYAEVKRDAEIAVRKLAPQGILVFNDYIMYDPFQKADYGIVPVVNEMVVNRGWKVIGFALQKHMFCDIAICRA
jgi:Methyltransferase domain